MKMSPRTATIISLALLSLTLTVTLSSAHSGCPGSTVGDVLKHYDIPTGLFPNDVKHFSCEPVRSDADALKIWIELEGACKVTREIFKIKNVLVCEQMISATISRRKLTNVNGITVDVSFANLPIGNTMILSQVKVDDWSVQFISDEGLESPAFPKFIIPSVAPACDKVSSAAIVHNGCPGSKVGDVLSHYDIPAGLFPNDVKHFSCEPVSSDTDAALKIRIELKGACKVTREFLKIKNVLQCEQKISATISRRKLTNVNGVTVDVSFANLPIGNTMILSQVKVDDWSVQFISDKGLESPAFPKFLIPSVAPACDSDFSAAADAFKYARILPFIA